MLEDFLEVDTKEYESFAAIGGVGEIYFATFGKELHSRGWTCYPQEANGKRRPWRIDGATLAWKPYQTEKIPPNIFERWLAQAPGANVAVIMGPTSGNVLAFDIDVTDEDLSLLTEELLEEICGPTPYKRIGNPPKIALFYRLEQECTFTKRTIRYAQADDETAVSPHMVEILGKHSTITFYGVHHSTGRMFGWLDQPAFIEPEKLPVITEEQIDEFIERMAELRPIYNPISRGYTLDVSNLPTSTGEKRLAVPSNHTDWAEDPTTGLITDGREKFLAKLVFELVRANPSSAYTSDDFDQLSKMAFDVFIAKAERSGRWNDNYIWREIYSRVQRNCQQMVAGDITPNYRTGFRGPAYDRTRAAPAPLAEPTADATQPPGASGRRHRATTPAPVVYAASKLSQAADMMDFIPSPGRGKRKGVDNVHIGPPDPALAQERALQADRTVISKQVQDRLTEVLDEVFADIYRARDENEIPPIHVVKAPTGSGKTSRTIQYIARDPRTQQWDTADPAVKRPGPLLFMLPTYNNIQELRDRAEVLNLDPNMSDEELESEAAERGLTPVGDFDERVASLRRDASAAGLKTMIYKGKEAAGCQMQSKLKLLREASMGSSGLCKADVGKGDEKETKFCVHYQSCPAIQQKAAIEHHHVVFMPHAFLTLTIPEELKSFRAVIADESIFQLFVHTTNLSLTTLQMPRAAPRLSKKQKEAGEDAESLLVLRDTAATIAANAMVRRKCPAAELHRYRETAHGQVIDGSTLVAAARQICGDSMSASQTVNPDMSEEDIRALVEKPTGVEIAPELRFWKIIESRLELLKLDDIDRSLVDSINRNHAADLGYGDNVHDMPPSERRTYSPKAKGSRDYRLQLLTIPDETLTKAVQQARAAAGFPQLRNSRQVIRMSWRQEANWTDKPLVLLDASASPKIITKIFGGRPTKTHEIPAALNVRTVAVLDRTYSNASLVAKHGDVAKKLDGGSLLSQAQSLISAVSGLFGYGRVVVGTSVAVRRSLTSAWDAPDNVDFTHFGAMRGLDFAKNHAAAISFGRMEPPVNAIDALVAALSYDDDTPEEPIDMVGEAQIQSGEKPVVPLVPQAIPTRDGREVTVPIPRYPGPWACELQKQYREEELRQFLGRLRPVYRAGEAPVWIAVSKVVPDNVVADEIVCLDDLLRPARRRVHLWNSLRLTEGVMQEDLINEADVDIKSVEAARDEMHKLLAAPQEFGEVEFPHRTMWGFRPVRIRFLSGPKQGQDGLCHVRTSVEDPGRRIAEQFEHHLEWEVEVLEVGAPYHSELIGARRSPDWVDQQIGTRADRKRSESNAFSDVMATAMISLEPEDLKYPDKTAWISYPTIVQPLKQPARMKPTTPSVEAPGNKSQVDKDNRPGRGRLLVDIKTTYATGHALSKMAAAELWDGEEHIALVDLTGEWGGPAPKPSRKDPIDAARPAAEDPAPTPDVTLGRPPEAEDLDPEVGAAIYTFNPDEEVESEGREED